MVTPAADRLDGQGAVLVIVMTPPLRHLGTTPAAESGHLLQVRSPHEEAVRCWSTTLAQSVNGPHLTFPVEHSLQRLQDNAGLALPIVSSAVCGTVLEALRWHEAFVVVVLKDALWLQKRFALHTLCLLIFDVTTCRAGIGVWLRDDGRRRGDAVVVGTARATAVLWHKKEVLEGE